MTKPPRAADWRRLVIEALWLFPAIGILGVLGGFLRWAPQYDPIAFAKVAVFTFFIPSLGEEIVFRAALLPPPPAPLLSPRVLIATTLFVAWHPLQALLYGGAWAAAVLNPIFLLAVTALGVALTRLYLATGSLWPSIVLHWVTVLAWKLLFGAPSPFDG